MKVLMLNGSPKANGNTNAALLEVGRSLKTRAFHMRYSRWAESLSEIA